MVQHIYSSLKEKGEWEKVQPAIFGIMHVDAIIFMNRFRCM